MYYYQNYGQNRQFLVPFLLGGIGGAAIAGAVRPRPVFVQSPIYQPTYGYSYYGGVNYNPYPYYR